MATPTPLTPIPDPRTDAELLAAHRALDAQVQQCRHDMGALFAVIQSRVIAGDLANVPAPAPVPVVPPAVAPPVAIVPIPPPPLVPVVTHPPPVPVVTPPVVHPPVPPVHPPETKEGP